MLYSAEYVIINEYTKTKSMMLQYHSKKNNIHIELISLVIYFIDKLAIRLINIFYQRIGYKRYYCLPISLIKKFMRVVP